MRKLLNHLFTICVLSLTLLLGAGFASAESSGAKQEITATLHTNYGKVDVALLADQASITVNNFISYARSGFYEGTLFHRVIPNFMIQGGGFDKNMQKKATSAPIKNEAKPSLKNLRGTLAMARTNDPHSATSQFFINVVDNHYLNASGNNPGYAVFGKVTDGMTVVDKIAQVRTSSKNHMQNVPLEPVIIEKVSIQNAD